ncbi:hypothetical protein PC112_g20216 [Phytophthora cactorum]|nr:hypothetical protein PC112_g20216 [Phytophthora cactorum]
MPQEPLNHLVEFPRPVLRVVSPFQLEIRRPVIGAAIVPSLVHPHHRDDHPSNGSGSLFRHFYQPPEWLFTHRDPTPPATEWRDDLIDVDHMRVSEDAAPGDVLATPVDPLTFEDGGWFAHLVRIYLTYEDEDRHAHWDSTHAFPISIAKRRQSRYLSGFYTNRKQRRSRAGPRWKVFLQ